jgi:hypothetical protein
VSAPDLVATTEAARSEGVSVALVEQDPDKFRLPDESDLRYNWAVVRMAAIDATELRELVIDAWAFVVPKRVADDYARREEERCTA